MYKAVIELYATGNFFIYLRVFIFYTASTRV